MRETIRSVDLFCGCGGLALGFENHRGSVRFETVLGVDIDAAALRVFNRNLSIPGRKIATGRLCDLFWFNHQAEIRLYYLVHYALWEPDLGLLRNLQALGLLDFLARLRSIDEGFSLRCDQLASSAAYINDWQAVDSLVTQLALFRASVSGLGLRSLKNPQPQAQLLPWSEEYGLLSSVTTKTLFEPVQDIRQHVRELWERQIAKLRKGSGEGVERPPDELGVRMQSLVRFLESASGRSLKAVWVDWRTQRESTRAGFVTARVEQIDALYFSGPRVHLLLGGPPCKGWSRIGRAVIRNLTALGLHAWSCDALGDERNALVQKYVLFLDALKPDAFLFENVAHFESSLKTPSGVVNAASLLEEALEQISEREDRFTVTSKIVSSRRHGIPQDRERYIMVGLRGSAASSRQIQFLLDGIPAFKEEVPLRVALAGLDAPVVFDYTADNSRVLESRVTAHSLVDQTMPSAHERYIRWIRQADPRSGAVPVYVDSHIVRKPRPDDARLFEFLAPGKRWMDYKFDKVPTVIELRNLLDSCLARIGQKKGRKDQLISQIADTLGKLDSSFLLRLLLEASAPSEGNAHHLLQAGYLAKGTDNHGDWLERLSPEKPCKTIVAHIGKDTYGYIHPWEPRALSLREAARVQSFPDYFSFTDCGLVDAYSVVGNAVPPLIAASFAKALDDTHQRARIFETGTTVIDQAVVANAS